MQMDDERIHDKEIEGLLQASKLNINRKICFKGELLNSIEMQIILLSPNKQIMQQNANFTSFSVFKNRLHLAKALQLRFL